jgi:hypothetical protein
MSGIEPVAGEPVGRRLRRRPLRRAVAAVIAAVVTSAVALVGLAAPAAAAVTAPYDLIMVDSAVGGTFTNPGGQSVVLDDNNTTITETPTASPRDGIVLAGTAGTDTFTVTIGAAPGALLALGTYSAPAGGSPTTALFQLQEGSVTCSLGAPSTFTVTELTRNSSGSIATFAAHVGVTCDGATPISIDLRWKSSQPYVAATSATVAGARVFGTVDVGQTGGPFTVSVTGSGPTPVILGSASITNGGPVGADVADFVITSDQCSGQQLAYGASCSISVVAKPHGNGQTWAMLTVPDNTSEGARQWGLDVSGLMPVQGTYYPLVPSARTDLRVMDTRIGQGSSGPLGPGAVVPLAVTGLSPSGVAVSAVVVNVTVTAPTAAGYLELYPSGTPQPTASSVNFTPGWTGANTVTVPVGSDGQVDIFNSAGTTQVIVDVLGYFASDANTITAETMGGQLHTVTPFRGLDTRNPGVGALSAGQAIQPWFDLGAANNAHVRALAVDITTANSTVAGYLAAWNGDLSNRPAGSVLNFIPGRIVSNFSIVPVSACNLVAACTGLPMMSLLNGSGGKVDVIVDVVGFYDDSSLPGGLLFRPITPVRITDTRFGEGLPHALGAAQTVVDNVPTAVADSSTYALSMNVTAINPSQSTFVTLWSSGTRPPVSTLNPNAGQTVPGAAIVGLTRDPTTLVNSFSIYNNVGTVDLAIDVNGAFYPGFVFTPPA